MSFDDRIGCAPQLVTACVALAAAIASGIYMKEQSEKRSFRSVLERTESFADSIAPAQPAFVNSGVDR